MLAVWLISVIQFGLSAPNPPNVKWVTGFSVNGCESHPHAGVQASDGGFLMVGDGVCYDKTKTVHRYVFAVKTDSNGKEVWNTAIGETGYNYGKWGIQLNDGNFVIGGSKSVTAQHSKCGYIEQRALWVLSKTNGKVLSEQLFTNNYASQSLREGMMTINPTSADKDVYVATGYVHGEAGECNDDEPMFLIFGGFAFLMKFKYDSTTHQFSTVYEVTFNSTKITKTMIPMQGMRVFDDPANKRYGISAATTSPTDEAIQFGMIATDYDGNVLWNNIYPAANKFGTGTGSHPYSLTTASTDDGWVIAGLALKQSNGIPEGRMAKIGSNGDLVWDTRFEYNNDAGMSVECYGVSLCSDKGYITTCGTGYEGNGHENPTWMALLHRTDSNGKLDWQKPYSNQSQGLNNAGEFVLTTNDGGYAMYIDSGTWGPPGTGGNFGLMVLYADD